MYAAEEQNGFGITPAKAASYLARVNRAFPVLPDTPAVHVEWQRLVTDHGVSGKKAHDARLVAAMRVHGIERILTFNTADFRRYPGLSVLHPADVTKGPIPDIL